MEMEMERGCVVKRKHEVGKKIIMVTSSSRGNYCAAVFEFPIKITTINNDYVIQSHCANPIEPITTFFPLESSRNKFSNDFYITETVSACLKGSELYLFANDKGAIKSLDMEYKFTNDTLPSVSPIVFDLSSPTKEAATTTTTTTTRERDNLPTLKARKLGPIVAFVGEELFVLSAYFYPLRSRPPEPCFEALNLDPSNPSPSWRTLSCGPISSIDRSLSKDGHYFVTGYAMLGSNFLLVSLRFTIDETAFYSYDFQSNKWDKTNAVFYEDYIPHRRSRQPLFLYNQAVVVGHDIYTFDPWRVELLVFSYVETKGSPYAVYDISLGAASLVEGFGDFERDSLHLDRDKIPNAAIAKVNNAVFCVLYSQTYMWSKSDTQKVHVVFIQLKGRGLCETIKSFTCNLSPGTDLSEIYIQSCHVMNDVEEKQDEHPVKRACYDIDDKAAAAECGSSVENKEAPVFETAI